MPQQRWPAGSPGGKGGEFAPAGQAAGGGGSAGPSWLHTPRSNYGGKSEAEYRALTGKPLDATPPGLKLSAEERQAAREAWERIKGYRVEVSAETRARVAREVADLAPAAAVARLMEDATTTAKYAGQESIGWKRDAQAEQAQAAYDLAVQLGYSGRSPLVSLAVVKHFDSLGLGDVHREQSREWLESSSSSGAMRLHSVLEAAGVRGSYDERDRRALDVSRLPSDREAAAAGRTTYHPDSGETLSPTGKPLREGPLASWTDNPSLMSRWSTDRLAADAADAVRKAARATTAEERQNWLAFANTYHDAYLARGGTEPHPVVTLRAGVERVQRYVREHYALHQAALEDLGLAGSITLVRGVELKETPPKAGERTTLAARPASSWTDNGPVAERFAGRHRRNRRLAGVVVVAAIPTEQIYTSHHLFSDASGEREFVVLGADSMPVHVDWSSSSGEE